MDLNLSNNEKINLQQFFDNEVTSDNIKLFSMMNRIKVDYCGVDENEVNNINDVYKLKLCREEKDDFEVDDRYLLEEDVYNPAEDNEVSISEDSLND